jgi:hypothetical protein
MRKRLWLLVVFVITAFHLAHTQTYKLTRRISATEMRELLEDIKELFQNGTNLSLSITSSDPVKSFDDMYSEEPFDDKYFTKQKNYLKADSLNPAAFNNLAQYYLFNGKKDSAAFFFRKSMDHLALKYFANDSARYLSFRALLKMNLNMDNSMADLERAIEINPNDSAARVFYPFILLTGREFDKLKAVTIRMLDNPDKYPEIGYVMLMSGQILSDFYAKAEKIATDEKLRAQLAATDYNKLFDFTLIDKYATKFKSNTAIRNARYLADMFALSVKLTFFKDMDKPNPVFAYPPADKNQLLVLENKFLSKEMTKELNPYTRNKALGFIYFMKQQNDKAIYYLNEAIKVFPPGKRAGSFNPGEIYELLMSMYFLNKNDSGYRKVLMEKINAEPSGRKDAQDHFLLAQYYFSNNDIKKTQEWTTKALQIDSTNIDALRMQVHLDYLDRNESLQSYADRAARNLQTNEQQYNLVMQFAIYYLLNGDAEAAYNNLEAARKSLEGQSCGLCEKLVEKYITVIPK